MNKEQIYDAEIYPLMDKIVAICKANGIAMLACYSIPTEENADLCCTTCLPDESKKLPQHLREAMRVIKPGPLMLTTKDASGNVTNMTAILP